MSAHSGGGSAASVEPCASEYTVRDGDSWSLIARAVGVKMGPLAKANGVTTAAIIHPGDRLCLPDGAVAPPVPAVDASGRSSTGAMAVAPAQGPCWFGDTWRAPRGNGRRHEGVDLIAVAGSYVYAVVDGTLTRRAWDIPGRLSGNAWWLTASDGSGTYYFYAHLSDFAPGLQVGSRVEAGEIIGFVGSTGSSATAHLHFEIHPGGGPAVNPYPAVQALGGCQDGRPYRQPGGWTPE